MQLSSRDIESFQNLWESEFGEKLSPKDAEKNAKEFLDLLLLLFYAS